MQYPLKTCSLMPLLLHSLGCAIAFALYSYHLKSQKMSGRNVGFALVQNCIVTKSHPPIWTECVDRDCIQCFHIDHILTHPYLYGYSCI